MTYPPVLRYDVIVRVTSGNAHRADRYNGVALPATGDFRVNAFSLAEERHPYVPHGINVAYAIGVGVNSGARPFGKADDNASIGLGGPLVREKPVEPFAIPEVSPLYSFGIQSCPGRRVRRIEDSGLKTIGSVTSANRRYRVTLIGTDAVDGRTAAHLSLLPLVDARRDRLRDLWIVPSTSYVVQARIAGNFIGAGETNVSWLIHFTTIDEVTYVDKETSEAPVRRGRAVFDTVEITFERIGPDRSKTSELPFAVPPSYGALNVIEEPKESFGPARC